MVEEEKLAEAALEICRQHIAREFKDEMLTTVDSAAQNWDAGQMRNVFSQKMSVWRPYGKFEVILDATGIPVGFVDHDKYLQGGDAEMTGAEATALLRQYGLLTRSASLERFEEHWASPQAREYHALFRRPGRSGGWEMVEVGFNPARRAIIWFRPVAYGEKR
jgi:hypothetical protein